MDRRLSLVNTVIGAILLCGCSQSDPINVGHDTNVPINWHVYSKDVQGSRALMTDDAKLQTACTPSIGGEAIAIWGSHNRANEPIFNGTLLTYEAKTSTTPHMWNYVDEPDRYWSYDTEYDFLAYYPADFPDVTATSTSFETVYNTLKSQEDLMLAYKTVNTSDASFDALSPVPLQMEHALAAVKFRVKSEDGRAMTLKSLSLSGLYTKGDFDYQGKDKPVLTDWTNHSDNTASYNWIGTLTFDGTAADVTGYTGAFPLATYAEDGFILVIPQQGCIPALDITTTDKVYDRAELGEVDLEPGKKYIYTVKPNPIGNVEITVITTEWDVIDCEVDFPI